MYGKSYFSRSLYGEEEWVSIKIKGLLPRHRKRRVKEVYFLFFFGSILNSTIPLELRIEEECTIPSFYSSSFNSCSAGIELQFRSIPLFYLSRTGPEGNVNLKMDFLTTKGGFKPRSIASQPVLLGYSLERVLIPRHTVLSILKALGLKKKHSLCTACVISERRFRELYVVPYEKDVLGLREVYAAAYGIKVSV